MSYNNPLEGREGLKTEPAATNQMAIELGQFAKRHNLRGAVLITFTSDDRMAVNSSGDGPFGNVMEWLGDHILAAIDDGKFDPPDSALEYGERQS